MKRVVVFGATSTVAQAICQQWLDSESGNRAEGDSQFQFFFIARHAPSLQQVCLKFGGPVVGHAQADLAFISRDNLQTILLQAIQVLGVIDTILIAHGDLCDQLQTEASADALRQSFEVNALSSLAILVESLQLMQQSQAACKFAVITSVAGQRGRPRNFTYGAAKGAVSLFLQGLRSVHYKTGFEFYDFRLGPVVSPMTVHHEKNFSFSTPEKVAGIIVKALKKSRYVVYVPGFWCWVMWGVRWLPEPLFQRLGFLSDR